MRSNLILLAVLFTLQSVNAVEGALLPSLGTARVTDVQALPGMANASMAAGAFAGNDNTLLSQLNAGLFPAYDPSWILLGKSDDLGGGPFRSNPEVPFGSLLLDNPIDGPVVLSLKAGNYHAAYLFNSNFRNIDGFVFSTRGLPFNRNPRDLSHASLYAYRGVLPQNPPTQQTPEPASLAVWALLAGGAAAVYRKRRNPTRQG